MSKLLNLSLSTIAEPTLYLENSEVRLRVRSADIVVSENTGSTMIKLVFDDPADKNRFPIYHNIVLPKQDSIFVN